MQQLVHVIVSMETASVQKNATIVIAGLEIHAILVLMRRKLTKVCYWCLHFVKNVGSMQKEPVPLS